MALTGLFEETSFQDLLQLYAVSRQTATLEVRRRRGRAPDGVFHFENGNLVGASLDGLTGREAIREALRLSSGTFRVEVGARAARPALRENLQLVLMEEVVRLDEARRGDRDDTEEVALDDPRTADPPPRPATLAAVAVGAALVAGLGAWMLRS